MLTENHDAHPVEQKFKEEKIKLTRPRKVILNSIFELEDSFTAEEVFIKSHKIDNNIGIATVYRTIKILEEFKILEKRFIDDKKPGYIFADSPDKPARLNDINKNIPANLKTKKYKKLPQKPAVNNIFSYPLPEVAKDSVQDKIKKEIELEELINDITEIDEVILRHENCKENLIQMLIEFQSAYNWLPRHVLFYVAKKLDIPLTRIYSIASFYSFFNLEPTGRHKVVVCSGTACHVRGSVGLLSKITNVLKINPGNTTPDYKFTLETVNCLGCCALGPVMMFDNKYYSNPSTGQLEKLFKAAK